MGPGAGTAALPIPACCADPRTTGQTSAHSTAQSSPKAAQPAAAGQCADTMALAERPVSTMPRPGPQKISPPSAACPDATSRAMHQDDTLRNTTALATPAAARSHGQAPATGRAMPQVSSTVAARPQRVSGAPCQARAVRGASHGRAMQARAPAR